MQFNFRDNGLDVFELCKVFKVITIIYLGAIPCALQLLSLCGIFIKLLLTSYHNLFFQH